LYWTGSHLDCPEMVIHAGDRRQAAICKAL
jgi:hypothetical protein